MRTAALAATAILLAAVPSATLAQDAEPSVRLAVSGLTGVLGPGSVPPVVEEDGSAAGRTTHEVVEDLSVEVLVDNDGDVALSDLRLVIETFPAVDGGRRELQRALDDGEIEGLPVDVHDEQLIADGEPLAPGDVAGAEHVVTAEDADWSSDSGVHPVRLSVLQGTQVRDRVEVAVVHLAEQPENPLQTTLVWPLDDPPWRQAGGVYPPGVDAPIQRGSRLERLVSVLEGHTDVPVLLAPATHLLEDLQDRAGGYTMREAGSDDTERGPESSSARRANRLLQQIREVATRLELDPVGGPYGGANLAGLLATDEPILRDAAGEAAREGRRRLQSLLAREPDPRTTLASGPVDEESLDLVSGDHLLVSWDRVSPPGAEPPATLDDPVRTMTSDNGRQVTATVGDPTLSRLLTRSQSPHGPVVASQRIVAETAMAFFDAPPGASHALSLHPPSDWSPDPRALDRLVDVLDDATWLELTDPPGQAAASGPLPELGPLPAPSPQLSASLATALVDAEEALESARASVPGEDGALAGRQPTSLSDQLLRATSTWLAGPAEDRALALVDDVDDTVDATFGDIEVSSGTQVTLTSDSGQIPVTLGRESGGPLRVRVEVESQGRLTWPEGRTSDTLTLASGDSRTVSFPTRALSRGTFPVSVQVTDATGTRLLDDATLSVRATAISRPALIITGAAIVLLLLLALVRRRRPPPRPELMVVGGAQDVGSR